MEYEYTTQQLKQLRYEKSNTSALIDDNGITDFIKSFHCYDNFNNYTFSVSRRKETTFISPYLPVNNTLVELKVGVLLPFHQSNNGGTRLVTMSGISAIRLAVAEINSKNLIPGAYITLVEKDSYPKTVQGQAAVTQAVFSAISLIQEGVIGVIGDISSSWTSLSALMTGTLQIPQCSFSAIATSLSDKSQFKYFFRTAPTNLLYSDAAISFITSQGWPQIGVLYSDDDFGQQLSENVLMKARQHGIHVKSYQSFYEEGPKSDIKKSIDALFAASGTRIIFIAAEGAAQIAALTVAAHSGYINDDTVWMTINADTNTLYAAVADYNSILLRRANGTDIVPDVYNKVATIDFSQKSASRSKKAQSLLEMIDPVEYSARTTANFKPIEYNSTFSGGVFLFDTLKDLTGYAPFDNFVDKWSRLDPAIYPYGGQNNISSNEGLAYSCMMVMASGFNNTVYNSLVNTSAPYDTLQRLAAGELGQYLTPSTFNTSFLGPDGPVVFDQNGDVASGNFKIYNIQNGSQIEIGKIIAGSMHFTSPPIYHDGTKKIPTGVPDRVFMNPGYQSPITITLLVVSSLGTFLALLSILLVLVYRNREIFKSSSPLFCVLELIGFVLAYISLFFFVGNRTQASCTIIPITFHLGYSLILGNLIAKNYRVFRIFNNIYISKSSITDYQLLKVSGSIFAITSSILVSWFASSRVATVNVPVSKNAYYVDCEYQGVSQNIFISLLSIFGSFQLLFATFLAFKTRTVGRNYSRYSEYKQIGLSVYNIFFSALIGFIIYFVPTTDYYTRHYLTATMIVWATTFSLLTLFLPKLISFFTPSKGSTSLGKLSDLSGKQRHRRNNTIGIEDEKEEEDSFKSSDPFDHSQIEEDDDLMSLNYIVNNSHHPLNDSKVKINNPDANGGGLNGALMEVHEADVPIQQVFKYFPFLAAWEMMSVVLMPGIFYFSFYSEKTKKGKVFAYSGSSILISEPNEYILKIHGTGMFDCLMQVESEKELMIWNDWFNSTIQTSLKSITSSKKLASNDTSNYNTLSSNNKQKKKKINDLDLEEFDDISLFSKEEKEDGEEAESDTKINSKRRYNHNRMLSRQIRSDSGITAEHLLGDENEEDDRRGSETTVETLDSCYFQPVLSTFEYGTNEIVHAREMQQQQQQQQEQEQQRQRQMSLLLLDDINQNNNTQRTSFFNSFTEYLPTSNSENTTLVGTTPPTDNHIPL